MRWPWSSHDEEPKKRSFSEWTKDDWFQTFTEPRTLLPSVAFTVTTVAAVRFYKSFLRRIPTVNHIKPDYFRRRSLFGRVTSVGDADNFRLFHTPGGRLAGWGLLPWKTVPTKREDLTNQTLHVRIAGVDAPELAHWGREAQPFSKEAMDYLTGLILRKRVRVYLFRRDQYDRIVAQVYVRRWFFFKKDVGLEMLKLGLATVYEAKSGAEFGTSEAKYRAAEEKARGQNVGLWTKPSLIKRLGGASSAAPETPREYKARHAASDKQKKAG